MRKLKLINFLIPISIASLMLLLSGCARECVIIASGGTAGQKVSTSQGDVRVTDPASRLASQDLIQAKVNLENNSRDTQSVQYKFQWYSEHGFNAGESTPWQPVVISPYSSEVVSDVAPMPSAVKYNVLVCRIN